MFKLALLMAFFALLFFMPGAALAADGLIHTASASSVHAPAGAALLAGMLAVPQFGRKEAGNEPAPPAPPREEKQIAADLEKALGEVKKFAEDANTKLAAGEALSKEAKAGADAVLVKLAELRAEFTEMAQKQSRRGGGDEPERERRSIGQQVGGSEELKSFQKAGGRGTVTIGVKAVTSAGGSAGGLITVDRQTETIEMPRRRLMVRDLLMPGRTVSNSIEYPKQSTRTNNAAPVAEGAEKPESNYGWTVATANVRTIAHWVPVSRQAIDDVPQLESLIDGELRYGLDLVEEAQLLTGAGTGQNLHGLIPQATAYNAALLTLPDTPTMIDILRIALLQAELAEYPANGIVLNPIDWAMIEQRRCLHLRQSDPPRRPDPLGSAGRADAGDRQGQVPGGRFQHGGADLRPDGHGGAHQLGGPRQLHQEHADDPGREAPGAGGEASGRARLWRLRKRRLRQGAKSTGLGVRLRPRLFLLTGKGRHRPFPVRRRPEHEESDRDPRPHGRQRDAAGRHRPDRPQRRRVQGARASGPRHGGDGDAAEGCVRAEEQEGGGTRQQGQGRQVTGFTAGIRTMKQGR
jgi:HK97 family phage major capsid protein